MNLNNTSILITGGNGMLAHAIRAALTSRNLPFTSLTSQDLDISDAAQVQNAFAKHKPTVVFNCAAFTNVDKCELDSDRAHAVNGHGVGHLASSAKSHNTRLIHISTDFVFDGTSTRPYKPTDPTNPLSAYGRSKLLGESLIQQINPPHWLIARTSWLFGPDGHCFPKTILNAARAGKPLKVVNDQQGSPTYTPDLATALLTLLDHDASGLFHLSNTGQTTWHDFTAAILKEFSVSTDLSGQSSAEWKLLKPDAAHRPSYSVLDTSDYTRITHQSLPHWSESLRAYRLATT